MCGLILSGSSSVDGSPYFAIGTAPITIIASGKFSLWIVAFSSLFFKKQFIAIIHGKSK